MFCMISCLHSPALNMPSYTALPSICPHTQPSHTALIHSPALNMPSYTALPSICPHTQPCPQYALIHSPALNMPSYTALPSICPHTQPSHTALIHSPALTICPHTQPCPHTLPSLIHCPHTQPCPHLLKYVFISRPAFNHQERSKAEPTSVEIEHEGLGQAQHHSLQKHTLDAISVSRESKISTTLSSDHHPST